MSRPEKIRLGDLLITQGLMTQEQLSDALATQKSTGRKLGRVLEDKGLVTAAQIADALARQMGVPFLDLTKYRIDPAVANLLPETQARRFRAVVLQRSANGYQVGFADPTDLFAYDEISRILKAPIDFAIVLEEQVLQVIDRVYRKTEEISGLAKELEADVGDELDFGQMLEATGQDDAPVVRLLQKLFEDAIQVRASDIHIEPQETQLQIRFRIDGMLHPQTRSDLRIAAPLALRLKLISGLDISEKRLPQDGRFVVKTRKAPMDVRISTMPSQFGESVVMRLLRKAHGIATLDDLNMPNDVLPRFREAITRPNGLVLVTGPTGSGKTTTLYAALEELNNPETKIITVEDPIEYRLAGITQVQINEKIELDFSRVLRSALRHDPDIILLGEMRDHETAQIGLRAALTGHMVLTTLHTNDAASTPVRLMDMGVPPYLVATAVQGVLAQRLVRLVCERCASEVPVSAHEASWLQQELGAAAPTTQRQGSGCSECYDTGYRGRAGVYEYMEMTRTLIEACSHADPNIFVSRANEQLQSSGTMSRHAAHLVAAGKTTVYEAMRVSHQTED
jgi:MSHA biogenesis protein MshE